VRWQRFWLRVLVACAAAMVYAILFGSHGLHQTLRLHEKLERRSAEAFDRIRRNERVRERLEALRTDPLVLEDLARRRLGLVRPDEIVYVFREQAEDPD